MDGAWPNASNNPARASIHHVEALGAALAFGIFALLPLDRASALGGALGRRIGPLLGVSERARRNIKGPFPSFPNLRSRVSSPNTRNCGKSAFSSRGDRSRRTALSISTGP
jgi:lauroyl/myristoyl acyltransferase